MRVAATAGTLSGIAAVGALGLVMGFAAAPHTLIDAMPASAVQPVQAGPASAQTTQSAVQSMLDRVLGTGHAVVRVVAEISRGDGSVTTTQWGSSVPALSQSSVVVAGANATPVAVATQRTNAIGTTTTTVRTPVGALVSESVAVAVDTAALGRVTLGQLRPLIDSAAGYSASRGDVVTVVAVPFSTSAAKSAAASAAVAAAGRAAADRVQVITAAIAVAVGLLLLGLVTLLVGRGRSGHSRVAQPAQPARAAGTPAPATAEAAGQLAVPELAAAPLRFALPAGTSERELTRV